MRNLIKDKVRKLRFFEYLSFLLDVRIKLTNYKRFPGLLLVKCMDGDASSLVDDLDKLLEKPLDEFTPRDWASVWYVNMKIKGK